MEIITAEQALEEAKGMTFEKMWAMMMEDSKRAEEFEKRMEEDRKRMEEDRRRDEENRRRDEENRRRDEENRRRDEENRKLAAEKREEDRRLAEEKREKERKKSREELDKSMKETDRLIKELSKNIGGVNHSLGELTESMFSANLWRKFGKLGFPVSKQSCRMGFYDGDRIIAEVDVMIENGEYAIPVEIKTKLTNKDTDEHIERIGKVRGCFDERGDKRKLVGAMAGGIVSEKAMEYAHEKGLFVIVQSGDAVTVADPPKGFKAREWVYQ